MSGPVAYQFHVALRHISPKIWRRVQLRIDDSLADLHRVVQTVMGWSDEFQHRFRIRNHCLGASRPGGLLYFGDPVELKLEQFKFRLYERFTYEYNSSTPGSSTYASKAHIRLMPGAVIRGVWQAPDGHRRRTREVPRPTWNASTIGRGFHRGLGGWINSSANSRSSWKIPRSTRAPFELELVRSSANVARRSSIAVR